jgi:hypothetical protein
MEKPSARLEKYHQGYANSTDGMYDSAAIAEELDGYAASLIRCVRRSGAIPMDLEAHEAFCGDLKARPTWKTKSWTDYPHQEYFPRPPGRYDGQGEHD